MERFAEKAFTFVQMCATIGLINVVLRTVMRPTWAFMLTVPWVVLALLYVAWPLLTRHERTLSALDDATGLLSVVALALIVFTLWFVDLLSKTITIAA